MFQEKSYTLTIDCSLISNKNATEQRVKMNFPPQKATARVTCLKNNPGILLNISLIPTQLVTPPKATEQNTSFDVSSLLMLKPFNPLESLTSNFFLQNHPSIKHWGHENKGNDHQLKKLLIVEENSPCKNPKKCLESSKENIHTDVRV